ncbi:MAG: methionine gamma-lyase family protein [Clostridia bacterium]|nr:methionine gamma-lyase family protein [Clostridia bacterium]
MFSEKILALAAECEKDCREQFEYIDDIAFKNTQKVMSVFAQNRLSDRHFAPTSGYGYNDDGRDLCDKLFADAFGAEAGFARHSIINGTHALSIGLYALLRPGDTLLSVAGKPYDTLDEVIGISGKSGDGSLADFNIGYKQIDLDENGYPRLEKIKETVANDASVKVVFVQRSKGYSDRRTLTVKDINDICDVVRANSNAYIMVDNCYGAFTEESEPKADLLVGSLIKNAGGGMAESGGYLVGTAKAVELASYRYSTVGVGLECGASLGQTKSMIKGLFYAPHTVAQAVKTAVFAARVFEKLGFNVSPKYNEKRSDIIQTFTLGSEDALVKFCLGIQAGSPVDAHVAPVPWEMPGYNDRVIMAAGAFTQGSSIELSCDGPVRPPYIAYLQGGLTYESGKYGILKAAQTVTE